MREEDFEIQCDVELEALITSSTIDEAIEKFQANPNEITRAEMIVAIARHAFDEVGVVDVNIVGDEDSE